MTAGELVKAVLMDEPFFFSDDTSGRGGVTLSGGEPLLQPEFCMAVLRLLGQNGVHRAIDTSGHVPDTVLREAALHCELFLYDLKHMDTDKHREYTGVGNELILSNLEMLSRIGSRVQIRVPFIPGLNSDEKNISAVAGFAARLSGISGVRILPYHRAAADKHRRWGFNYRAADVMEPTEQELREAAGIFEKEGLAVAIGG